MFLTWINIGVVEYLYGIAVSAIIIMQISQTYTG